ncbi:MAG TPA: glycosyl hydrolase, partial [Myxococcaceae bacterium]
MSQGTGGHRGAGLTGGKARHQGPWVALVAACAVALASCEDDGPAMPSAAGVGSTSSAKPAITVELAEPIYESGLKSPWEDAGWSPREVKGPGPAKLMMAELGGWAIKHKEPLNASYGALALRYQAPAGYGEFLEA